MAIDYAKLDNPVWYALEEVHQSFAIKFDNLRCYQPDVCPFGASDRGAAGTTGINAYARLAGNFFIVGHKPTVSKELSLKNELICLQMALPAVVDLVITENIVPLNDVHEKALFDLVNLVQPGYFRPATSQMGDYYGIFKDNRLVSVTGERMKMNNFTELSAIVTHPGYTGHGYAKQLIAYTANKIFAENKVPYLHVAESNTGAIRLYEKLNFFIRRKISFWNIVTQATAEKKQP